MNPHSALHGLVATAALAAGLAHGPLAHAQAPGEDPVVLTKKLTVNMQPTGGPASPATKPRHSLATAAASSVTATW